MRKLLTFIGIIGLTAMFAQTAMAQSIPQECLADPRARTQYLSGVLFGQLVVEQAWSTIDEDCDQVENFVETMEDSLNSLTPPPRASLSVKCRYMGIVQGGMDTLDSIELECAEE